MFASVLKRAKSRRIKYVIPNRSIVSSMVTQNVSAYKMRKRANFPTFTVNIISNNECFYPMNFRVIENQKININTKGTKKTTVESDEFEEFIRKIKQRQEKKAPIPCCPPLPPPPFPPFLPLHHQMDLNMMTIIKSQMRLISNKIDCCLS